MQVDVSDRKIQWLASYPKSGNTWVRMFLNAYITGFPLDINSAYQYVLGDNNANYFQMCYSREVSNLSITEQVMVRPAVLMNMINMSASTNICLKTHHAKVQVNQMPLIPADITTKSIYIVRDPRDVAISFASHSGTSIDETVESMADGKHIIPHTSTNLSHILTSWSLHVESWTSKNVDVPVKIIKYEDMLEDTNATFKEILHGLGFEDIDEKRFNFALKQTEFKNLQRVEEAKGFREKAKGNKFFRVGKSKQWKSVLSEDQISKIEEAHFKTMCELGYLPVTSN